MQSVRDGERFDLIVAGGGNAALCAALAALENSEKVLLLEKAPAYLRAGNTRHTRDIRYAHDVDRNTSGPYKAEELTSDILRVTGGETNMRLTKMLVEESQDVPDWMEKHGAILRREIRGTLHLGRSNAFFLGGGKAVANTYYETIVRRKGRVLYESAVEDVLLDGAVARGVVARVGGKRISLESDAVVVACGGFESNLDWLRKIWGDTVDNFIIRGTRYNDGELLSALLGKGAMPIGNPKQAHMAAVDARSPKFDGGIVTRVDSIPFGIVVNKLGRRFYDEGEEEWPKRYAIWGKLIAEQPDQIAYSIFDTRVRGRFLPPAFPPYRAATLEDLARQLDLDFQALSDTIREYNHHTRSDASPDYRVLDECSTSGLDPPKSHWATQLTQAPYFGYALRPGLTFTYMGLAVDEKARVLRSGGEPFRNLYAAGEIMAGNILGKGYLGGLGLTIGTVFGRKAGVSSSE